jgi:hypothetical protein
VALSGKVGSPKMSTPKQTRDSTQTATEKHPTTGSLPVQETYLTVRLWSSDGAGGSVPAPLGSDSPAVSLTTDLIVASKGASVTSRDGLLLTSFHAVLPAVSTARRLQWAIQGLAESRDWRGTSIAVLIHYAHDLPVQTGHAAVRDALEQAAPGQILLTESIGKSFDDLPGFPSRTLDNSGLRELLWRAPEVQSTRSFDEQLLTQLFEQQGLQDDVPEETIVIPVSDRPVESDDEEQSQSPGFLSMAKSPLGIGIAAAAVLLVAAFFIYHSASGKSKTAAADATLAPTSNSLSGTNSSTATPPSQPSTDTSKTSASPTTTSPPLTAAEKRKQERLEKEQEKKAKLEQAKTVVPPIPAKPAEEKDKDVKVAHGCDEDAGQYSRLLDKGKTYYSQGHYSDAVRVLAEVVKCQPGNGVAREWLGRAQHEKESE